MNDTRIATTRVGINGTIGMVVAYLLSTIFGVTIDMSDPVIILIIGGGLTIFYRISVELAQWQPVIGRILFGINKSPSYPPPPPPNGGQPLGDVGRVDIYDVLVITAIAIAVVAITHAFIA